MWMRRISEVKKFIVGMIISNSEIKQVNIEVRLT